MKKTNPLAIALREKLARSFAGSDLKLRLRPDENVKGSEGLVYWTDDDGVTFGDNAAEQLIIDEWLTELIGKKIGFRIIVIAKAQGSDGRCAFWFKRFN